MVRVCSQEAGRPKATAVWIVAEWTEVRALGKGSMGPRVLARGAVESHRGVGGPCPFSTLNERRRTDGRVLRPGRMVSLALGLRGPQSSALQCQAPWEATLGGRHRFRVSPQEAGRPEPMAVRQVEEWAEVRVLGSRSIGPRALARGSLKSVTGGSEGPSRSGPE